MKEQWKLNSEKFLEEAGLQQDKQKCAKKMREQGGYSENGCCNRWTRYIKLIIYLELALFLGWSCFYMIIQTYHFQEMENDSATVVRERYSLVQSTIPPNTKMPVMFVKPEVFLSKLNDLLENTELIKGQDLMQDNTIATDAAVRTSKSDLVAAQSDDKVRASGVDSLLSQLLPPTAESFHDRSTMLETNHLDGRIKNVVSINRENEGSIYFNDFLSKLRDSRTKESGILESLENKSDFVDGINPLIFINPENLENNVEADLRDFGVSATNNLGESTQRFPELTENTAQDDRSEKSSASDDYDENNEGESASFESERGSRDSVDTSLSDAYWLLPSSSQQSKRRVVETSEQINDEESDTPSADVAARNENKYDVEDSVVSTPASPDAIALENNDDLRSSFDKLIAIMRNVENRYSPKIVKDSKEENPQKNTHLFRLPLSHDDSAKFSVPTLKFRWYSPPAQFANDQPDDQIEIIFNKNLLLLENFRQVCEEFSFLKECRWGSERDNIKLKCFFNASADEEKGLPYFEKHMSDIPKVTDHRDVSFDYADYYDDEYTFKRSKDRSISNENSDIDEEVAFPRNGSPESIE